MSNPINNCAVVAIAAVTGEAPQDIAAGIAAFLDEDGGPAFVGDAVKTYSVGTYLESRGWTELLFEHRPSIPWTGVLHVPGHFFALVDGCIHDAAGGGYFGEQIISIWVPPSAERPRSTIVPKLKFPADHGCTGERETAAAPDQIGARRWRGDRRRDDEAPTDCSDADHAGDRGTRPRPSRMRA